MHSQKFCHGRPGYSWPAAPDGSPHCNNAVGRTGAQGGNPTAPGAFWASWADALHMIDSHELWFASCPKLLLLDAWGLWSMRQTFWTEVVSSHDQHGKSCVLARDLFFLLSAEPGEWQHGWQYHASSSSELHFRETLVLAQSCALIGAQLPVRCCTELQQRKGNVSCTSYSRTFYDTQMATANCGHPHAQLEHA